MKVIPSIAEFNQKGLKYCFGYFLWGPWSRGYDAALTRRRSPVRIRPAPSYKFSVTSLPSELSLQKVFSGFKGRSPCVRSNPAGPTKFLSTLNFWSGNSSTFINHYLEIITVNLKSGVRKLREKIYAYLAGFAGMELMQLSIRDFDGITKELAPLDNFLEPAAAIGLTGAYYFLGEKLSTKKGTTRNIGNFLKKYAPLMAIATKVVYEAVESFYGGLLPNSAWTMPGSIKDIGGYAFTATMYYTLTFSRPNNKGGHLKDF